MTEALTSLLGLAQGAFLPAFLVFLRIGAAMTMLPAFGEMMIPARVKLGAAIAFTTVTLASVFPDVSASTELQRPAFVLMASEVATGLVIGFSLRLVLVSLQVAASMAAQATSLSQLLGGASVDPQPALGVVLLMAALALSAELGLHVQFSMMFINSYAQVELGAVVGGAGLASWATQAVGAAFEFAFVLAAPFLAVSLLYNLALGVINRAMPQLMVAFVGAPAITLGALVLLALTAPLILALWADQFQSVIRAPFGAR